MKRYLCGQSPQSTRAAGDRPPGRGDLLHCAKGREIPNPSNFRLRGAFQACGRALYDQISLGPNRLPAKVVILVSGYDHCLADLLYRQSTGELACDIVMIVSNHATAKPLADFHQVPFHLLAHPQDKGESEREMLELIGHNVDLIVLARYMQILSPEFVAQYLLRIINIHHSFLPAFVGARPYHQAFARGVKLIGATSHYVTATLDEGPIIVYWQSTIRKLQMA